MTFASFWRPVDPSKAPCKSKFAGPGGNAAKGAFAGLGLAAFSMAVGACGSSAASPAAKGTASKPGSSTPATSPVALRASTASWQLRNPLSRMVVLPAGNNGLAILGGLTAADTSASGVFRLDLANGSLATVGTLPAAVHDAAGAVIGSNYVVFGGGSVSTVGSVDAVPSSGGSGTVIGKLPQPRSDCAAVTVNGVVVIAGGYNGSAADTTVLETTDGTSFRQISSLKVAVRYPALAAVGNSVYVFGGIEVGGQNSGKLSASVQKVDISTGTISVVGSLPEPLDGAMAFVLGGHVYLAGGDSGSAANPVSNPSVWLYQQGPGFTQVATLPLAVSNAGVAVSGGAAWIVGGEHDGKATAVVQTLSGTGSGAKS
ncbi:MAG: hypothetical protein EPN30_08740 [Actinomycetota bacterium]|nr:MAG: hypothetical protein EPN30_08740 [Actinomycetota bacterium]